jgi:hypothetical protein
MPRDQWKFVTTDETLTDEPANEELAVRVDGSDAITPAHDPGRADVLLGAVDEGPPKQYFADEEPEDAAEEEKLEEAEADLDLEGLLEEQHYAFPDEPAED